MQPVGLDDRYQGIAGCIKCRKVDRTGQKVGEFGEGWEGGWRLIDDSFTAILFEYGCKLWLSMSVSRL